jgi:type I restriction enzyme, S subunit
MKNGWTKTYLSDVASVESGSGFPDKYQGQVGQEIPFYKVSDMNIAGNEHEMIYENNSITNTVRQELGAFLFPKGSVIFPKIGGAIATNKKRRTTRDCCVDNNVMGVIPKAGKIDSDFLFYFFLAHDLSEFANEAHLPSIKKTVVEAWEITLPTSLTEQQRIVGILVQAFEGIAAAKANAEKNLQNSRALFESHLHSDYAEKAFLGDLVRIQTGKLDANAAVEGGRYPFFTCSREIYAIDRYAFDCEAILLAGNNAVGDFNVKHYQGKFNAYQRTYVITVNEKKRVLYRFLYFQMLKSLKKFKAQSVGTGTKFLKLGMIKDLEIELPSLDEQQRIVSAIDAVREETQRLASIYERKLAALEALKKSLLHQAFTGKL